MMSPSHRPCSQVLPNPICCHIWCDGIVRDSSQVLRERHLGDIANREEGDVHGLRGPGLRSSV